MKHAQGVHRSDEIHVEDPISWRHVNRVDGVSKILDYSPGKAKALDRKTVDAGQGRT